MNQCELVVNLDNIPQTIKTNYEEVRAWVDSALSPYKTLLVTEDTLQDARVVRAKVNKLQKQMSEQRIALKKCYMHPFTEAEEKIKSLEAACAEVSKNIDEQVKAFEEKEKTAKIEGLSDYFTEHADECDGYLDFGSVYNARWRNTGFDVADAKAEIDAAILACKNDIDTIRGINTPYTAELLATYKQTRKLADVLRKDNELKALAAAEQKRKEQQEKLVPAAAPAVENVTDVRNETPEEITAGSEPIPEPVKRVNFWVQGTVAQLTALGRYLRDNSMPYGSIR